MPYTESDIDQNIDVTPTSHEFVTTVSEVPISSDLKSLKESWRPSACVLLAQSWTADWTNWLAAFDSL